MYGLSKYINDFQSSLPIIWVARKFDSDHAGSTQGLHGSSSTTSTRTAWTSKRKFSDNWKKMEASLECVWNRQHTKRNGSRFHLAT